ncbi:MAG: hypothetical protein JKY87_08410 [Mariprofundus sp.]|nr:hypothetical protein [Mariprofundus sp.]
MKKILFTMSALALLVVTSVALIPTEAEAIPVFARKYDMSCNACHTMFPKLSKMGVAFRERGFRFAEGKEDLDMQSDGGKNVDTGDASPAAVFASNFPFTIRTQVLFSGAGPITDAADVPVMPGHRFGMLDGALVPDGAGNFTPNQKIGFGEFGMISSGSYDNLFWWLDANTVGGIGMLEVGYYVNDLFKVRVGRVQNNVGYGMTMMSQRPLGFGTLDSAQMTAATMLMMGDGISIHGTTNGDSGIGTYYNFSLFTYGKVPGEVTGNLPVNAAIAGKQSYGVYGRLAQEINDNHIIGVFGYSAKNWVSDILGGEAAMLMAMNMPVGAGGNGIDTATAMQFSTVTRYGVDFAINYGEPMQIFGAITLGKNKNPITGQSLKVRAATVVGEWNVTDSTLFGVKVDYSNSEYQMANMRSVTPKRTVNLTAYALYQVAQNVQAFASVTRSSDIITSMTMGAGNTIINQTNFTTAVMGLDIAL